MAIAFSANKRVVVLRDGKFYECIAFEVGFGINTELDDDGVLISFEDVEFHKEFITIPVTMSYISFVLVDPTQEVSNQIVGIAERDDLDESAPGRTYLLK